MLRSTRQQLHAQIAEALETHSPELMDTQPELFAQHYEQAGLIGKSVTYWGKAGHRSTGRSAMVEAAAQFQKGLHQLALLPDNFEHQRLELEFRVALGGVLNAIKGNAAPETGQAYTRARELWEQLGSPSEFLHIPYGQSRYHMFRGEFDLAQKLAEELLALSQQRDDAGGLVLGHFSSGRNLMLAGRFASSRSHLLKVLALYDPVSHGSLVHQIASHPHTNSRTFLGLVLFCLGYPDQGLRQSNAAIDEAQRLTHPQSLAVSLTYGNVLLSVVGDSPAFDEQANRLLVLATEQGFRHWHAEATVYRGWLDVKNGDVAEGISQLRSGSSAYRSTGAEAWTPNHIALLARAYEVVGEIERAVAQLDYALQIAARTGVRWFIAELNRHKGQLVLRQGHPKAAEQLYRKAMSIAQEQEAKLWELRAAVSLARLHRDQGRRAEARELLAPVYDWFTEGFGTPDLKEARALLDELA